MGGLAGCVLMAAVLAGCGGSSDDKAAGADATSRQPGAAAPSATPSSSAAPSSAGDGAGGNTAFCADAAKAMGTDDENNNGLSKAQGMEVWDRMDKEAPASVKENVDYVDRQLHQQAEKGTMDDISGFGQAYQSVLQWVAGNCGMTAS
ncbi:MAG: hypothetical protein HOV68_32990 [Streptomycetaceae bacterium]|nr:hypothetical protein [Streptomycetaceae bacterium]